MPTVRPIPAGTIRRRTGIIRTIRHPKQPTGLRVVFLGISVVSLIGAGPSLAARQEAGNRVVTLCDSAYAQLERGDTETALAGAAEAVELDPASARAHTCLGRVYLALPNRTHEAIECFQTALFMEPDHIETLYWKARAHLRLAPTDLGRFNSREALKNLERLLELDPSHPDAAYLCGVIYRDHYEQYERAIAAFRLQIEANPGHSEARIALLKIQIDTGDWAGAIATAETLLRRDPADHTVYPFLAAAHWKAGRGDDAMAVFDRYFGIIDEPERALFFNLGYMDAGDPRDNFLNRLKFIIDRYDNRNLHTITPSH